MSNNQDNAGASMMLGGLIAAVVAFGFLMKFLQRVFIQFERTFNAFAKMLASFFGSLWTLSEFAILLGLIVAAIYFTYKFIVLVKKGNEIKDYVSDQVANYQSNLMLKLKDFESDIEAQVQTMRWDLSEALKKPEVKAAPAPENPSQEVSEPNVAAAQAAVASLENTERGTDVELSAVMNPY